MLKQEVDSLTPSPQSAPSWALWGEDGHQEALSKRLARLRSGMTENVTGRDQIRETRKPKGHLRYPPLDAETLWAEFEAKTQGDNKVQIRWWRESDNVLLEGEAVAEHIRNVTVFCATHRTQKENDNHLWAYEVFSGLSSTRPVGDLVIQMIESGKVSALIVPRKDRWNRNVEFNERSKRALIGSDTVFCSVAEQVDITTAAGYFFDTMLTAMAQFDGAVTKIKLHSGRVGALRVKGIFVGGEPPLGYRPITFRARGQRGVLEICDTEAEVVRLIFWLRSLSYRPKQIADYLNKHGILTRKACIWTWGQVQRILEREAQYRAEALWNYVEGEAEAIAHPAILPHRADSALRTYMLGYYMIGTSAKTNDKNPRPLWKKITAPGLIPPGRTDMEIPDDPSAGGIVTGLKGRRKAEDLTTEQAGVLLLLYRLVDAGQGDYAVAKSLNEMGLSTLKGAIWTPRAVTHYRGSVTRNHYLTLAKEMGVQSIFIPIGASRLPTIAEEQTRYEAGKQREIQAREMMFDLRRENPTLSLKKIADTVSDVGLTTLNGKRWHPTAVNRVLAGHKRAIDIPGRDRRRLANHISADGVCDPPHKMHM